SAGNRACGGGAQVTRELHKSSIYSGFGLRECRWLFRLGRRLKLPAESFGLLDMRVISRRTLQGVCNCFRGSNVFEKLVQATRFWLGQVFVGEQQNVLARTNSYTEKRK